MTIDEVKKSICDKVKFESFPKKSGGQTISLPPAGIILNSEELGLTISVNYHGTMTKNKILASKLFEVALNDLIK